MNGVPITFTLQREPRDGLEKANWSIVLADMQGKVKGEAHHASTLPANARNTAYEATLTAAVTSKMPQMRNWLAELAQETQ